MRALKPFSGLLAFAFLLAAAPARAEDWWFTGPMNKVVIGLVDADSIRVTGETRTAMIRGYARPPGPPLIVGAEIEVDCAAGRSRRVRQFVYSLALAPIEAMEPPAEARAWETYRPDQPGDITIRFICGRRPEGDFPTRIGRLYGGPHDRDITFVLMDLGIPIPLAVQFGLGDLETERAEALLRSAPSEAAATLRSTGLPRPPRRR